MYLEILFVYLIVLSASRALVCGSAIRNLRCSNNTKSSQSVGIPVGVLLCRINHYNALASSKAPAKLTHFSPSSDVSHSITLKYYVTVNNHDSSSSELPLYFLGSMFLGAMVY
jgi:hypothetical protein